MMKFNKAILHCGGGKTGSTKLQFTLDASRASLLNEGILAYPPGVTHSDLANTVLENPSKYLYNDIWRRGTSDAELLRIGDLYLSSLEEWLNDSPECQYLMFSCEAFCTLNSREISRLFNYLKRWSKEQTILFYVRDPVGFAKSAYSQNIKQGIIPLLPIFDWKSSLDSMEVGSDNNILVRKYESCLSCYNGIVGDFANLFGMPEDIFLSIDHDGASNKSLTAEAAALGISIIKALERNNIILDQANFFKIFGSSLSLIEGAPLRLPHDVKEKVIKASQPTYELLRGRYHINYDLPVPDSDSETGWDASKYNSLSFNQTVELLVSVFKNFTSIR